MRRVALRRRMAGPGPGGPGRVAGDVVGDVVAEDDDTITVLPADGPAVEVRREDVIAVRDVPPQAVRPTSSPDRLSRLLASHWPGVETERLGGWLLRAGSGFTRRANSTSTAGDPGMRPAEALNHVVQWYRERDLPPLLQVIGAPGTSDVAPGTDWQPVDDVDVLVGDLRRMTVPSHPEAADITVTDDPPAEWLELWRGGAGQDPTARAVLTSCAARYVTAHEGGRAMACARLIVDRRWAHVSCLEVRADARRRGLGRTVMVAAITDAMSRPADGSTSFVVVEVERANAAALALYDSLGMRSHHRYHYLQARDAQPSPSGDYR